MYSMLQYYDEVMMRLRRYYVSQELDAGTAEMIINRARRDVQLAIMPIYRERFTAQLTLDLVPGNTAVEELTRARTVTRHGGGTVTNRSWIMSLPSDFIDEDAVWVQGALGEYEARKLSKLELYDLLGQTWACPQAFSPVYCIEKDTESATYLIHVSKGAPAIDVSEVRVFYVKALQHLQIVNSAGLPDNDRVIPWDCTELVVYQAMLVALQKFELPQAQKAIELELDKIISDVQVEFNNEIDRSALLLPSREGRTPYMPNPRK